MQYATYGTNFDIVGSFGKYNFNIPNEINEEGKCAVVILKKDLEQLNFNYIKKQEIGEYVVLIRGE